MKVKVVKISGTDYYRLMSVEGFFLHYTPTWKTEAGARRYAVKHGYELVK